jgi:hypothetical protein
VNLKIVKLENGSYGWEEVLNFREKASKNAKKWFWKEEIDYPSHLHLKFNFSKKKFPKFRRSIRVSSLK